MHYIPLALSSSFAAVFITFWLIIIALSLGTTIFWLWMLIDAAKKDFPKSDDKILWILVLVFAGFVGTLIYYFVIYKEANKKKL